MEFVVYLGSRQGVAELLGSHVVNFGPFSSPCMGMVAGVAWLIGLGHGNPSCLPFAGLGGAFRAVCWLVERAGQAQLVVGDCPGLTSRQIVDDEPALFLKASSRSGDVVRRHEGHLLQCLARRIDNALYPTEAAQRDKDTKLCMAHGRVG